MLTLNLATFLAATGNYVQSWAGFLNSDFDTLEVYKDILEVLKAVCEASPYVMLDIELWKGEISSSALPHETAFPFRDAIWNIGVLLLVPETEDDAVEVFDKTTQMINDEWSKIQKYLNGVYLNYQMESLSQEEYPRQYWGDNLERLMELKAKYDPLNLFRHPQSVPLPA